MILIDKVLPELISTLNLEGSVVMGDIDSNKSGFRCNGDIKCASYEPYTSKELVPVGFSCIQTTKELTDEEIYHMIDHVIYQVLGPQGLAAIVKHGDKVVIKVNLIGCGVGKRGEKNRGGITDPRIVQYVAKKVRDIIGNEGTADLKVVDATFYKDKNPSLKETEEDISFYWARLEKTGDNAVNSQDICYDGDADGFLDGGSYARLINLDSLLENDRDLAKVSMASSDEISVCLPNLLRTRQEAEAKGSDEYCDVLIGLPILKSHGILGMTGAIKLHYGFRHYENMKGDTGRFGHSGCLPGEGGFEHKEFLCDYLCAEHIVRDYDFVIMDCITGNRSGPMSLESSLVYNSVTKGNSMDYILTNAILASKDSVAIDTVEAVLAGYDPNSIKLLNIAHENGLGTNNPNYILLSGFDSFKTHRKYLYENYYPERYPFANGHGGAQVLGNKPFEAKIMIDKPQNTSETNYTIRYKVEGPYGEVLDLSRVELWISNKLIAYRNIGDISNGSFIFDIKHEHLPQNSYAVFIIAAWDKYFNCITSPEAIYKF